MKEDIRILVVDDDESIRRYIVKLLTQGGYNVQAFSGGKEALRELRSNQNYSLIILDILMPDMDGLETLSEIRKISKDIPVLMLSALGQTNIIVKAMKAGATDYLVKPFEEEKLEVAITKSLEKRRLLNEISSLRRQLRIDELKGEFIYNSPKMQKVKELVDQVAETDVSVLIEGESGTGKELVARALHYKSRLRDKPFVKVNCAALPHDLLESELFGYERGAFTGAYRSKPGKFELANNGTIFLDEIGEMDLAIQSKLLQVLQEGTFSRLGGKQDVQVNVRVIAATNKDLKKAIEQGTFREDIYYRLNVVNIKIPPLTERREDITYLFEYFLDTYNEKYGKAVQVSKEEIYPLLLEYPWPGNVRELKNQVKRLVILGNVDELVGYLKGSGKGLVVERSFVDSRDRGLDSMGSFPEGDDEIVPLKVAAKEATIRAERNMILKALKGTNWNKKKAASLLKVSYKALLYKIKECGIEK
ncbi:MAG TPA: sigma-54 dependent transcriptional regulator [Deltaproteobacteria bacterium]|nr:sigma-54 dependent transcriptional regulator [Deltaproteobacteria bacterium]HPP79840.1 sigma-54 dependent transcriptional regulator [Deltaproteobacteria bacterium]